MVYIFINMNRIVNISAQECIVDAIYCIFLQNNLDKRDAQDRQVLIARDMVL